MLTLAMLLAAAVVGQALAVTFRLPAIPALLLAGLGLRVSGLTGHLPEAGLQDALLLGLAFVLFQTGSELNPSRVRTPKAAVMAVAAGQFLVMGGLGAAVVAVQGGSVALMMHVAVAAAASSTLVGLQMLQQHNRLDEPFGHLVVGVLLAQDALALLALAMLSAWSGGPGAVGWAGLASLLLGGLAWLQARRITPWILSRWGSDPDLLLLMLLTVLFTFAGLAGLAGLPLVMGAFWAGVAMAGFPIHGLVRGQLSSLGGFFVPVFFVTLGTQVAMPGPGGWALALLLAGLNLLVTTPLVATLAQRLGGLSTRASIESGLLLSQTSEISVVVVLVGASQGLVPSDAVAAVVLATVFTMTLTPLLLHAGVRDLLTRLYPGLRRLPPPSAAGRTLVIGCGDQGEAMLDALQQQCGAVLVVDDDPAVVRRLRGRGIEAVRADGAASHVLRALQPTQARMVVSFMRRLDDQLALARAAGSTPVLARVHSDAEAMALGEAGAVPVLWTESAAKELQAWIDVHLRCDPLQSL
jgi:CPA2 family monovalent cation:H+ antiporter-2